jgi:hypothetical protein
MNPSAADPGRDEAAPILDALRTLALNAPSPVIRLCLEEARKDIAHLAGLGTRTKTPPTPMQGETGTPPRGAAP